ncbi:MAG: hypothetical protein JOZ80_12960, partial [Acidobacteriaceae bacterium]|nr:hypothetical protein [Acidobacteriaceae bacterium]
NARLAVGGNFGDLAEAGITQEAHGEFATFIYTSVFGCDGRLLDPFLEALNRLVMVLLDLRPDLTQILVISSYSMWNR